jgi:hypothetical protein
MAFTLSRTRSFSSKAMPGRGARLAALEGHAAFQPEEFLEDQAELRRRAEGVQQAQVGIGRRKMRVAQRCPAVGQFELAADVLRQAILFGRERFQHAMR